MDDITGKKDSIIDIGFIGFNDNEDTQIDSIFQTK